MIPLAIIMVAAAVMALLSGAIIFSLWTKATVAERDHINAEMEAKDARAQQSYAEIATRGRDVDDTAGVLDQGKFFLPATERLYPRDATPSLGRDSIGEEPHA